MIEGEKVVLVPFEEENGADIERWMSDPYYKFYFKNMPEMLNRAQLKVFPGCMGMSVFMIYEKGQYFAAPQMGFRPIPLGLVSWDNVRLVAKTCEIGFIIDKDWSAKHLGKESLFLFLNYLFGRLGFHKVTGVIAEQATDTEAKLAQNAGFKFEGIVRDNFYLDGTWHNEKRYSILETEWKERFKKYQEGEGLWAAEKAEAEDKLPSKTN